MRPRPDQERIKFMKTTRHKNLISFWVMVSVLLILGVALAFAYVNLLTYHPDIFLTP